MSIIKVDKLLLKNFYRMDIIVRLLTIEFFNNLNTYGLKLYIKMQSKRNISYKNKLDKFIKEFKILIESIKKKGYDKKYPIPCLNTFIILEGSHRFACSLFYNLDNIYIETKTGLIQKDYSLNWFKKNNFSLKEQIIIEKRYLKLLNDRKNINIFVGFLWGSCEKYFKNIMEKLNRSGIICFEKNFKYKNITKMNNMILNIYNTDDIDINKVKNVKLKNLKKFNNIFKMFILVLDDPKYRIKNNGNKISTKVEFIKKIIRSKYKKYIQNYVYDIIIHIADNRSQSEELLKLFM